MACLSLWLQRLETMQSEWALTCFLTCFLYRLATARTHPPRGQTGGLLIGLFFGGAPTWFVFGTPAPGGKKVDKRASVHHGPKLFKAYGPRLYAQIF